MLDTTDIKNARTDRSLIERAVVDAGADIRDPKKFCCPFHDDANPSAGIFQGSDGGWRFKCHACDASGDVFDIVQRSRTVEFSEARDVVLSWNGSTATRKSSKNGRTRKAVPTFATPEDAIQAMLTTPKLKGGRHTATWTYKSRDDTVSFQVARFDFADRPKDFRPLHPVGDKWAIGDPPAKLPLYRLPQVLAAIGAGETIYVCEGEKAADAAVSIGLCATTSAHGCKSPHKTDWTSLAGASVVNSPDNDEPGREYADTVATILTRLDNPATVRIVNLQHLPRGGDIVDLIEHLDSRDDADIVCGIEEMAADAEPFVAPVEIPRRESEHDAKPEPRAVIVCMADVKPRKVSWLWADRIPLGKQSLIVGDPELGKSFLTIDIASRVTTGVGWPDSRERRRELADVLILSAEDGAEDTIRPRLDAAEAEVSRVHLLTGVQHPEDPDGVLGHFSFQRDLRHLRDVLDEHPSIRLVIVDPLSSYLGQVNSHNDAEIRGVLAPLSDLAEQCNVAVLSILHNNKSMGLRAIHRVMGSTAFVANARAAWGVCRDPNDPDGHRRLMLQIKNNLAPNPGGLAFRIIQPGCVHWYDGGVQMSIDEAMAPPKQGRPPSAREHAEAWIKTQLNDGPVPAAWMLTEGEKKFAARTFQRAKENLGIKSRHMTVEGSESKQSHWCLP